MPVFTNHTGSTPTHTHSHTVKTKTTDNQFYKEKINKSKDIKTETGLGGSDGFSLDNKSWSNDCQARCDGSQINQHVKECVSIPIDQSMDGWVH